MILAELNTEHFQFKAVGASIDEAKERVTNAFMRHLKQYGSSMQQWREDIGHGYPQSAASFRECLEDWYGINTYDFGPTNDVALRDGEKI